MVGIIVADINEVYDLPFKLIEKKTINQFEFLIFENNVVLVNSGIGIINSAAATQELITSFKVKSIINYGAVGANKELNIYDIVTPSKIFLHDAITPWYDRGVTPGEPKYFKNTISSKNNNNLASGSSFISKIEELENIKKDLDADIFDMEGAAIAQVATKNNIPLKMIKVVSDSINVTNISEVEDINIRIKKAGKIAFDEMLKII